MRGNCVRVSASNWRLTPILLFLFLSQNIVGAFAGEDPLGPNKEAESTISHIELYNGISATENSWFTYLGAAWAPFGSIEKSGLRLRILGGKGAYSYSGGLASGGMLVPTTFEGKNGLAEVMLGYFFRLDPVYLKVYAGASWEQHLISPTDPQNDVSGDAFDAKGQIELWLNLGKKGFLSADASYASAFGSYNAMLKVGYEVYPDISLGPELGALGNDQYDGMRLGTFVRLKNIYGKGEISVSGGVTGDYEESDALYGTLSYSTKF